MGDHTLNVCHSSRSHDITKSSTNSGVYCKSDLNLGLSINRDNRPRVCESLGSQGEYYKRYEHDDVPVKDSSSDSSKLKNRGSLTNSDLEQLETRIFKNVSQELQTDDGSLSSLESNFKFFKTTVEKIFDNFYTSMRDFEHYKKRFHAILDRSKDGSIDDMEEFIKDMFEHIMSSENSTYNISRKVSQKSTDTTTLAQRQKESDSSSESAELNPSTAVLEAYKNDYYLTDSTQNENSLRGSSKLEEYFNIFLVGGHPSVEIKTNDRNLLSEINIREPGEKMTAGFIASADNIKKVAAKRLEVERYVRPETDQNIPDRDIPVKVSFAKKNIYLNEDFARNESQETSRSLISKICSILCKKFRKSYVS